MKIADPGPVSFALNWTPVLVAAGLPIAWLIGGLPAGVGFAIGGAVSIASLWMARLVVGSSINEANAKLAEQARLQLLLLLKVPLFAIVIFFTNSLGMGAISAFLGGYLLVYLALVLGALKQPDTATTTDENR
ncbi:MAG: hypothetical protein H0W86_04980 [Armatimonadetes bacterium]|nr:hypothetical protein [Armatimonadota bacterium]